ncbi:MAG: phosphate/phosphite/phosphonate ABC transporter substrate-binding protein [Hydrogenophilus sp.]|nr:phosphate/phosphite/phosphonate ABC transporter substrate-binding protein [Hydrogenophilus sp.]
MSFSLLRRQLLLASLLSPLGVGAQQPQQPSSFLTFGVVPYLSARKLAELYEPIRAVFAAFFAQPVLLESAPNYRAHFARTAAGAYDLIATSPYFGRIAQLRYGFVGLARPSTELEPVIIVLPGSPITHPLALQHKRIAASDAWAHITLAARRYLREQGLLAGRDFLLIATGNHANAWLYLQQGQAEAAVLSISSLKQLELPADQYRILLRLPPSPPLLYLAHQRLGSDRIAALAMALQQWSHTSEGSAALSRLGHGTLIPIRDADWQALDSFVAEYDLIAQEPIE